MRSFSHFLVLLPERLYQGNPHAIFHCNPPFISLVYEGICKCIDKCNDADCGWLSFIEASLQDLEQGLSTEAGHGNSGTWGRPRMLRSSGRFK